ncbi:helix-turn-helix domain-containing protein [Curtobacterium flaccumfaciens]|nr:helix-turn-helix transcriptional regulator [Curtobacterium flaccumfaciens]UXN23679.1 helix-turn-helix domain-containing protein [Curtobacterium flaccumfaciens pv. flaccumfaciens]
MRIGELRRLRGWTQERLAETSGIAVRTVQRMESGNDASLESLSAVATALEVPVRDLFATEERRRSTPGCAVSTSAPSGSRRSATRLRAAGSTCTPASASS